MSYNKHDCQDYHTKSCRYCNCHRNSSEDMSELPYINPKHFCPPPCAQPCPAPCPPLCPPPACSPPALCSRPCPPTGGNSRICPSSILPDDNDSAPIIPSPEPIAPAPTIPNPEPIAPAPIIPSPGPSPTEHAGPTCPMAPTCTLSNAYLITTTSTPSGTGTALSSTPTTLIFNAPISSRNITMNDSSITFPTAGTYYVSLDIPVTTSNATTINLTTSGTGVTVTPSTSSTSLGANQANQRVIYTGLLTALPNGTLTYTINSSATGANTFQGTLSIFRIA